MPYATTIDADDIARFQAVAASWWDENGPFRPLHRLNPARISFIRQTLLRHFGGDDNNPRPFAGLRLLDAGCGGGLVAEPMARLGAAVTGFDATAETVNVARAHAAAGGLEIDYRPGGIEEFTADRSFDAILALEVIEHVADADRFLQECRRLIADQGVLILSTLNQTMKSYLLGIVAAEYVLRWLPQGTHDWQKFQKPSALAHALERAGFRLTGLQGLVYRPFSDRWELSPRDLSVNYFAVAVGG
ncbi:MAG: bifunctional 3-demethylubiquinol 3-O-methyltransferase/2-polyprenyl-6-hydroxyphenol methylase [Proteobacteria bacterium]|nr:MAG: bifunctional 3-demethylubiquinol 3-O-methyltransferase/2-polyprenyl-6-hydroxyphenol methylase [Pseudomonadota bacterium]